MLGENSGRVHCSGADLAPPSVLGQPQNRGNSRGNMPVVFVQRSSIQTILLKTFYVKFSNFIGVQDFFEIYTFHVCVKKYKKCRD